MNLARFGALLLGCLWAAAPLAADEAWILQVGPEAVNSVPGEPAQPVSAWRGLYSNGQDRVWVYATSSPHFFAPAGARAVADTPWTVVVFFPEAWGAEARNSWLDRWTADFKVLATLPDPGWPILYPSVLRKP